MEAANTTPLADGQGAKVNGAIGIGYLPKNSSRRRI